MRIFHGFIALIGLVFYGCIFPPGMQITPGGLAGGGDGGIVVPDSVRLNMPSMAWQGQVAGLDSAGRGGAPAGIDMYRKMNVKFVGVPYHHDGDVVSLERFKRNYIADLKNGLSAEIFRTYPTLLAMYGSELNLGAAILGWMSPEQPGPIIGALVDATKLPLDGLGFDIEEMIEDRNLYPETREDAELAKLWKLVLVKDADYAYFRGREIAIFYRALYATMKFRHTECQFAVVYSAWDKDVALNHHGCGWKALVATGLGWRGQSLPTITYGMVGYPHPVIPTKLQKWAESAPIPFFYNTQTLVEDPSLEAETYKAKIFNLLQTVNLQRGDGLGIVDFFPNGYTGPQLWDREDEYILGVMIHTLGR